MKVAKKDAESIMFFILIFDNTKRKGKRKMDGKDQMPKVVCYNIHYALDYTATAVRCWRRFGS